METLIQVQLSHSGARLEAPVIKADRSGWLKYGAKNAFPQELLAITDRSPVHTSILKSKVTYMAGKGFKNSESNAEKYIGAPNPTESWDEVYKKMAVDLVNFNGFYGQVILNNNSTTVSLYHQDFTEVRIAETDDAGNPKSFLISKDWKKVTRSNPAVPLEIWPGIHNAKKGKAYMFYYYEYKPGQKAYCLPDYFSAIDYIEADGELAKFYLNCINNGFSPSAVITMPSNPSEDEKNEFQKKMEGKFTGTKGANRVVTLWGENGGVKPGITPFEATHNADTYNNVEGIVFQKIVSAHRLASPTLAGVSGSGNLSGNAAEIIDAYVLYNYTVVESARNTILNKLNIFSSINGTGFLEIDELDVIPKIQQVDTPTGEEAAPATLSRGNRLLSFLKALIWK